MDTARSTVASVAAATSARRADAGDVRLGGRDVAGLLLVGDMYGAPYGMLAEFLGVAPARLRRAGYAATAQRTAWPRPGVMLAGPPLAGVTGQRYTLAHIRAGYLRS